MASDGVKSTTRVRLAAVLPNSGSPSPTRTMQRIRSYSRPLKFAEFDHAHVTRHAPMQHRNLPPEKRIRKPCSYWAVTTTSAQRASLGVKQLDTLVNWCLVVAGDLGTPDHYASGYARTPNSGRLACVLLTGVPPGRASAEVSDLGFDSVLVHRTARERCLVRDRISGEHT